MVETCNVDALRIDAGENVFDGAILARRIHALKNQQHRPVFRGVKPLLHFGKPDAVPLDYFRRRLSVETSRLAGFLRFEPKRLRSIGAEGFDVSLQLFCECFVSGRFASVAAFRHDRVQSSLGMTT